MTAITISLRVTAPEPAIARVSVGRRQFAIGRPVEFDDASPHVAAIEYALAHQDHLKGLVVSNMMASIPAYNEYAEKVLMPAMDPAVLAEIKRFEAAGDTANPRYMELLMEHHYVKHILRMPIDIFPAINVDASSTRKEELLLPPEELALVIKLRRVLHALDPAAALELLTDKIRATKSNEQFLKEIAKSGS